MIVRLRLTDGSIARSHPEGEVVLYDDHAREVARLRALLNKASRYSRAWKAHARQLAAAPKETP